MSQSRSSSASGPPANVVQALRMPREKRNAKQRELLESTFLATRPEVKQARDAIAAIQKRIDAGPQPAPEQWPDAQGVEKVRRDAVEPDAGRLAASLQGREGGLSGEGVSVCSSSMRGTSSAVGRR